jgi:cytochrome P450
MAVHEPLLPALPPNMPQVPPARRFSRWLGRSTAPTPIEMAAFGGGAHFCLGANLARREITVAFEELHRLVPDIHAVGEPDLLHSAFIHGIKRLPVAWTPPR